MSTNPKINWYRTPIDKDQLKALTRRSDFQGFIRMISLFVLIISTGSLAYYSYLHWPWWAVLITVYLYGTVQKFMTLTGAGHELSHNTVFKTRFWNDFFIKIFSFLTWTNYVVFKKSHVKHHQYTVHREYDGEVKLPAKISKLDLFFIFTIDPKDFYYVMRETITLSLGILESPWYRKILPESDTKGRKKAFRWARIMLFGHIFLAAAFIYFGQWFLLVLVTFANFYARWLRILCNETQHTGMQPDVPDYRLSTRSIKVNPFVRFLYCNMNFHLEHHMYAAVPFYNLPKLHKIIEYDLPRPQGLISAWRDIFYALKRQKKQPEYHLEVELPASAAPFQTYS